jgi:hypothetical protein
VDGGSWLLGETGDMQRRKQQVQLAWWRGHKGQLLLGPVPQPPAVRAQKPIPTAVRIAPLPRPMVGRKGASVDPTMLSALAACFDDCCALVDSFSQTGGCGSQPSDPNPDGSAHARAVAVVGICDAASVALAAETNLACTLQGAPRGCRDLHSWP